MTDRIAAKESDLIEMIYAAVGERAQWQIFLDACRDHVGALAASFAVADAIRPDMSIVLFSGWTNEDRSVYARDYAPVDPIASLMSHIPEGTVGRLSDFYPLHAFENSVAYREFYRPRDRHWGCGGVILRTQTGHSVISFARGEEDGPFSREECNKLRPLMPHLKRAAILHSEMQTLRSRDTAFKGHLERYPDGLVLLDRERRVLYCNGAAEKIFGRNEGLRLEDGRLTASDDQDDQSLADAVGKAIAQDVTGRVLMQCAEGCRLIVFPLSGANGLTFGCSQPSAAVMIFDSDSPALPRPEVLRGLFGLTKNEAVIAIRLTEGLRPAEIASRMGVSIETVRTHIRRVMGKTATKRQVELVTLVLRSSVLPVL